MDARSTVKRLDSAIATLQQLRGSFVDQSMVETTQPELHGRHMDAPVWPWFAAGSVVGALVVLLFLVAWIYGRT